MAQNFDTILNEILTDYANLDPAPDTGIGSQPFITASVIAAQIYNQQVYIDNANLNAIPGTATGTYADQWGNAFGLPRQTGESDQAYTARVAAALLQPASGGNINDYTQWALNAVTSTTPIPANLAEPFLPGQVNTNAAGNLYKNSIQLGSVLQPNGQQYNPLGWAGASPYGNAGDPVQFTTTGTLPSPLVVGTTYYVTCNYVQPTGSGAYAWLVFIHSDPQNQNAVLITNQGTGTHTIQHAAGIINDPNSFYIADVQLSTPSYPTSPSNTCPPGSVFVWLEPNDETILTQSSNYYPATAALSNVTNNYINIRRPLTANNNVVMIETLDITNVILSVSPVTANVGQMSSDIQAYFESLGVGQKLSGFNLLSICAQDGASSATTSYIAGPDGTFSSPGSFDGTFMQPPFGHAIRLGTITINTTIG